MFSKSCEYGIRSAIFIAKNSLDGSRVGIKEIAQEIDSPEAFTGKILQILTRKNLIKSCKGVRGGYEVSEENMKKVFLKDLVDAIDGDDVYMACGLGLPNCGDHQPCPIHHKFKEVKEKLKLVLFETSLYDMALGFTEGLYFLKQDE